MIFHIFVKIKRNQHRFAAIAGLCVFLFLFLSVYAAPHHEKRKKSDERVYLLHADELSYDQYGAVPGAQIVKGHVAFRQGDKMLSCDSAYYFQESNSVRAFGHVYYHEGKLLSLRCDRATYDGAGQMMTARKNVVLHHHNQVLYTDSLNFDRMYDIAYFFDGGKLVDGKDHLTSDWGEYHTDTRNAVFYYKVHLRSPGRTITTDTLYYDVLRSRAHVVGPGSRIITKTSTIETTNGYFNTRTNQAQLYGRSTILDGKKKIVADTLDYAKNGWSWATGRVHYVDYKNKQALNCGILRYNEKNGRGFATRRPVAMDFSQKDTLYAHSDSMKIYTFHINTDSMYRKIHAYHKVQAYRRDVQAICDSMVFNTRDTCATLYGDPIAWSDNRQILGERMKIWLQDSTVRRADVIGQALSVEKMTDGQHYNQLTSKIMHAYFVKGKIRETEAVGNVQSVYYPQNDKDSSLIGLNYLETDTMRMFIDNNRKLEKIWAPKSTGTLYPISQIPPDKYHLPNFAWFEELRPKNKDDIFNWKGKGNGRLQVIRRHEAPLQKL